MALSCFAKVARRAKKNGDARPSAGWRSPAIPSPPSEARNGRPLRRPLSLFLWRDCPGLVGEITQARAGAVYGEPNLLICAPFPLSIAQ